MLDHQRKIQQQAEIYAQTYLRPQAQDFDISATLPINIIKSLAKHGYLGATISKTYGGLELDPISYGFLTEEIGKACCSTRSLLTVHTSLVAEAISRCGTKPQKLRWLPKLADGTTIAAFALSEANAGSDAQSLSCSYTVSDNNFLITGTKHWVTFGSIADIALVFARNGDTISAFIIELNSPNIKRTSINDMTVNKASHLAELHFDQVIVPRENLLAVEGAGFSYVANTALDNGRYSIAWAGVAITHECLDIMVSHANQRHQFGKKLAEFQLIQQMIADTKTQLEAAKALCIQAGTHRSDHHEQASLHTNIAKLFSSQAAVKAANNVLQVLGARGLCSHHPAQRLYREAKLLEIIEGSTQLQQQLIALETLPLHNKIYHQQQTPQPNHVKEPLS